MTDAAERVTVDCPACTAETVHEVLSPGDRATVRCTDCSHTHKARVTEPETVERDVVVSQDGESITTTITAPPDETLRVGDEFVVDTPTAILQVRVTSLQVAPEERVDAATVADVETVWTRAVDNVAVDATVHPSDDREGASRSVTVRVPGDEEFEVGETIAAGDEEFEVVGIQIRETAPDYRFEKLDHEGDVAFAKDVKRLYGRDATTSAWSAW